MATRTETKAKILKVLQQIFAVLLFIFLPWLYIIALHMEHNKVKKEFKELLTYLENKLYGGNKQQV